MQYTILNIATAVNPKQDEHIQSKTLLVLLIFNTLDCDIDQNVTHTHQIEIETKITNMRVWVSGKKVIKKEIDLKQESDWNLNIIQ